jgi:hypothetical protein
MQLHELAWERGHNCEYATIRSWLAVYRCTDGSFLFWNRYSHKTITTLASELEAQCWLHELLKPKRAEVDYGYAEETAKRA